MPIKNIYLTIDDSPSKYMGQKIQFLESHEIPAIFFCRGEFIPKHMDKMILAIQKGFLIGNHSYSHPFFSKISLEQCFDEILKTELLINECYEKAGIKRPSKVVRLPFGDLGAGIQAKSTWSIDQTEKVYAIQMFLKEQGFIPLSFNHLPPDDFIDVPWDWDSIDYKEKNILNEDQYIRNLENFWNQYSDDTAILMIHDFDRNTHLFDKTMSFLLSKKVQFLEF